GQDFGDNLRSWVAWKKRTPDLFAARRAYVYPVFYREKTWLETIIPLWVPPNEIAASPAGLSAPRVAADAPAEQSSESTQDAADDTRKN
ncbi:MAG: hypothetical protein JNK58_12425, partial [Phycisphaerae bacterium]|nr:hypothetical protein [Phycisphaerae bacterium]